MRERTVTPRAAVGESLGAPAYQHENLYKKFFKRFNCGGTVDKKRDKVRNKSNRADENDLISFHQKNGKKEKDDKKGHYFCTKIYKTAKMQTAVISFCKSSEEGQYKPSFIISVLWTKVTEYLFTLRSEVYAL